MRGCYLRTINFPSSFLGTRFLSSALVADNRHSHNFLFRSNYSNSHHNMNSLRYISFFQAIKRVRSETASAIGRKDPFTTTIVRNVLIVTSCSIAGVGAVMSCSTSAMKGKDECLADPHSDSKDVILATASRAPVKFGSSIIVKDSTPITTLLPTESVNEVKRYDIDDKNKSEDCPICAKYSRGPCGELFKTWLKCTDDYPGKNAESDEDLHLSMCSAHAERLADCLSKNEVYYSEQDDAQSATKDDDDGASEGDFYDDEAYLKDAWEELVHDMEQNQTYTKLEFPIDLCPELEVHLESNTGVAFFRFVSGRQKSDEQKKNDFFLIMAYVKDQDGTILAAGSRDDIEISGWNALRFDVQEKTSSTTTFALYEKQAKTVGQTNELFLYTRTSHLPHRY